jgi:PAS domain S-box-containing protein
MAKLPPEAVRDVESYRYFGIKSTCVFPLAVENGAPLGALGFNAMQAERSWPETIVKRLQLVAQIFTNALARKRAESELVKSEQRLRLVTNALPVLISCVDSDLCYRFNNEAYRAWFGVGPEEACGRTIREVTGEGFFHRVGPFVERALSGEPVRCALDVTMPDGRPLSMEAIYVPDAGEQGVVRGIYVMALDVTERNLAQQESRRLQDELFHAGRVSTLGELAGALAHEINQPLSAIMSNAQAAKRYLSAPAPDLEEVKEILDDIIKEDAHASEIINRMRALLRKSKMEAEPVDLNSVFREIVTLLKGDARGRDIKVDLGLDPRLSLVRGDRIQLQQVALNLVLNAFESMNEQPHRKRCVQIRTGLKDAQVLAAVKDNGVGFSVEDTEEIFQPFYTTKTEGLGMGLAICRFILLRHRGHIWAEKNPDEGATFHFSLPAVSA